MARELNRVKAVGYMRTSSAANVGPDRDSDKRQRRAIAAYAKRAGYDLVAEYYDPAVSGADPIETRPGFASLLDRVEDNGVRVVLVEDASRFARDLLTQELGIVALIKRGMKVITAAGDDLTDTSDPMKIAMRQIAGSFSQLEKSRLVAKLRAARDRNRKAGHRVEGRKPLAETAPKAVAMARELRRQHLRMSLREIARKLAEAGYKAPKGTTYHPGSIAVMLSGPAPTLD